MARTTSASSTPSLPLFYRLTLSLIEPLLAIGGALQALFYPQSYLDYVTPRTRYTSTLDPLFTQIVGGWCIIIYMEMYALPRVFNHDLRVWRQCATAFLLSDAMYVYAIAQDWGWVKLVSPWQWAKATEWATMLLTILPISARLGLLLGIGMSGGKSSGSSSSNGSGVGGMLTRKKAK